MKKITNLVLAIALLAQSIFIAAPVLAAPDCSKPQNLTSKEQIQCGINDANGGAPKEEAATTLNKTITNIINLLSVVVGIVAVIMIIFAGFRYITSGGKQESVTSAKNTILYAVIGLIIVALAQIIARFVLNVTTK